MLAFDVSNLLFSLLVQFLLETLHLLFMFLFQFFDFVRVITLHLPYVHAVLFAHLLYLLLEFFDDLHLLSHKGLLIFAKLGLKPLNLLLKVPYLLLQLHLQEFFVVCSIGLELSNHCLVFVLLSCNLTLVLVCQASLHVLKLFFRLDFQFF